MLSSNLFEYEKFNCDVHFFFFFQLEVFFVNLFQKWKLFAGAKIFNLDQLEHVELGGDVYFSVLDSFFSVQKIHLVFWCHLINLPADYS